MGSPMGAGDRRGFVVYWSRDRLAEARRSGWAGRELPYAFGGPHVSHPPPSRYGVSAEDMVYPICVIRGVLFALCELTVADVMPLADFFARVDDGSLAAERHNLRAWLSRRQLGWLAPTCTDEAVLVSRATQLRFDAAVPPDRLADIRFRNSKGERPLNGVRDGRLASTTGVTGHYFRLTEATQRLFAEVVRQPVPYGGVAGPSPFEAG